MPFLQLLFSMNTIYKAIVDFIINQLICIVSFRKAVVDMKFVLCYSPFKVSSNPCIESGVVFIREDINDSLERH